MSVTRFVPYAEPEFPWYSGIEEREDGEYVLYTDYAALEARGAGLERERDAAVTSRDGYLGAIEKMAEERDALQAKLAAEEEALRHTCKHLCQWKDACETGCPVSAILAGHAPATSQADHIADTSKKVQAAPSDREKRLVKDAYFEGFCTGESSTIGEPEEYWDKSDIRAALADTTPDEVQP